MVVKSQLKYIKSLQQKKYRSTHNRFVAEGLKTVSELLDSGFKAETLMTTEAETPEISGQSTHLISVQQMGQISSLKNPSAVLGVFEIPGSIDVDFSDWVLALDRVRDPGNLGTIRANLEGLTQSDKRTYEKSASSKPVLSRRILEKV